MSDVFSKEERSEIMRKVKSKNTKPEMIVRRFLFQSGFRYRLHDRKLPGAPDIKLPRFKTLIFINGCLWHGHSECSSADLPQTNMLYWKTKIRKNIIRDKKNLSALKSMGWKVITIWECDMKRKNLENTFTNLLKAIRSNQ